MKVVFEVAITAGLIWSQSHKSTEVCCKPGPPGKAPWWGEQLGSVRHSRDSLYLKPPSLYLTPSPPTISQTGEKRGNRREGRKDDMGLTRSVWPNSCQENNGLEARCSMDDIVSRQPGYKVL